MAADGLLSGALVAEIAPTLEILTLLRGQLVVLLQLAIPCRIDLHRPAEQPRKMDLAHQIVSFF
jgi:hypothetical protein